MEYQAWTDLADSPELTADYPYQVVIVTNSADLNWKKLIVSQNKFYMDGTTILKSTGSYKHYSTEYGGTTWPTLTASGNDFSLGASGLTFLQANNAVYVDNTYADVYFDLTT